MSQEKIVNTFALIGGFATGAAALLGLLVLTGRVNVSVTRTKKEKPVEQPVQQVEMATDSNSPTN